MRSIPQFANGAAVHLANRQKLNDPDTWLTPRYVLQELGEFDLDPCATEYNPTWVCSRYFTKEDNGLLQEWSGRVFMNPPFSRKIPWIEKHAAHACGISLVPAQTESKVWRNVVWRKAKAVTLLTGRTRFANMDGSQSSCDPLRGIALIAWSDSDAEVLRNSRLAGVFLDAWTQI